MGRIKELTIDSSPTPESLEPGETIEIPDPSDLPTVAVLEPQAVGDGSGESTQH